MQLQAARAKLTDSRERPSGDLKITTPPALGINWLIPRLDEFTALYPDIRISLIVTDEDLDLSMREADVAIRTRKPTQPDLIQRKLFSIGFHAYCSPEYIKRFGQTWKVLRGGSFPLDEAKDLERAERTYARGLNPPGVGRQLRAILASGNRKDRLGSVKAPTLVIHGTIDPLVRVEAGKDTAASIPGAKLLLVEGMGHALPIPMWPTIIGAIAEHARAATGKR